MCTGWKRELFNTLFNLDRSPIYAINDSNETVYVLRNTPDQTIDAIKLWLYNAMIDYGVERIDPIDWATST